MDIQTRLFALAAVCVLLVLIWPFVQALIDDYSYERARHRQRMARLARNNPSRKPQAYYRPRFR